jgi:hypothetical protein
MLRVFSPLSPGTSVRLTGILKNTHVADVLGERGLKVRNIMCASEGER